MNKLLLILLFLIPSLCSAQLMVTPETPGDRACNQSSKVERQVDGYNAATGRTGDNRYTVASTVDSQGRCTLPLHHEPFKDELYSTLPNQESILEALKDSGFPMHNGFPVASEASASNWSFWTVYDHLQFRAGYVAVDPRTHTYFYFHRYGHLNYMAIWKGQDQWALLDPSASIYYGTIYAADPPLTTEQGRPRVDQRLISRFPFVYKYQFPYQPAPQVPEPIEIRGR